MHLLENPTRSYTWGSRTVIADLLGQPASEDPQAELWIGAHPEHSSRLVDGGHDLWTHVSNDPGNVLGARVSESFNGSLPYLLKVLAIERPLSLQVHPDQQQALAGYAEGESTRGAERIFRDGSHKAEMVFAVSDSAALLGFRARHEAHAAFEALARRTPGVRSFGEIENLLDDPDDETALRSASKFIASLDAAEVEAMLECLPGAAANSPDRQLAVASELAGTYPRDHAVLLALLLNYVELTPGEAVGVNPRMPHTYLRGTLVELTTCSDNTIRAGLTSKATDIGSFLDMIEYASGPTTALSPRELSSAERTYTTGHDEFELGVVHLAPGEAVQWSPKPRTILVLDGKVTITDATGSSRLGRGDSVFVSAECGDAEISGAGVAVQATTGV